MVLCFIKSIIIYWVQIDLFNKDETNSSYYYNADSDLLIAFTRIFDSFLNTIFVYFIVARIESCAITYQFMVYQRDYRIEELDIAKDEFNRFDRESQKLSKIIMIAYIVCIVLVSGIN